MNEPYRFTDEEKTKYRDTIRKLNDIVEGGFYIEGEISVPKGVNIGYHPAFMMKLFNECVCDDLFIQNSYLSEILESLAYDSVSKAIGNIINSGCFDISLKNPEEWVSYTEDEEGLRSALWEVAYE